MNHLKEFIDFGKLRKILRPQVGGFDKPKYPIKVWGERPSNIPKDIQSEYDSLAPRLMDGGADPDVWEVEDRIEEIREQYPNIKTSWSY